MQQPLLLLKDVQSTLEAPAAVTSANSPTVQLSVVAQSILLLRLPEHCTFSWIFHISYQLSL